jgi:lipopolysaccharide transport system permease protein
VNIDGLGMPYAAFAMIGTLLWQTFVEAIQSPLAAVQSAKPMLAKINFPREAILMSGLYMVLFNFLIRLILIAGVMLVWRIVPGPALPLFPLAMAGLLACGFAVYPARTTGLAAMLTTLNPVSPVLVTARESLTNAPLTLVPASLIVTAVAVGLCFLGVAAYRLVMPLLIERMGG